MGNHWVLGWAMEQSEKHAGKLKKEKTDGAASQDATFQDTKYLKFIVVV